MLQYIMDRFFPKPKVLRDDVSQRVMDLLFPELVEKEHDGQIFLTDYSIDSNLYAVLLDLEDGTNDEVTRETIRKCYERLQSARALLQADHIIKRESGYLMVDTPN
jgi:hypothetical protein